MINGAHVIIYSKNAEADKSFFKNVLKLKNIDVGNGWLIFALPPSEIAIHPTTAETLHELYFMCDDISAFVEEMNQQYITCSAVKNERWGLLTELTLPGSGKIGVYQPKHERP